MNAVSVIVPVYNNSKFLPRCLESICGQTYKNLQIICVDDGSTDGAGDVLDEFAKVDERIIALHKKNGGESNARNTALQIATGDYIAFCDCDDWIDPQMYEILLKAMEESGSDLAAGSWYKETAVGSKIITNKKAVPDNVFGKDMLLRYIYERDNYQGFAYMWNKLYRSNLFFNEKGERLLFDEFLELGGDVLYLAQLAVRADKAIYVDRSFYHYRLKESSGSHTNNLKRLRDWIKAYEMTIQLLKKSKIDDEIINYAVRFVAYRCSNLVEEAARQGNESIKEEFQRHMNRYEDIYVKMSEQHPEWIERYKRLEAI